MRIYVIEAWYGSHPSEQILSSSLGNTSSFRQEKMTNAWGALGEGEKVIRDLATQLKYTNKFHLLLVKSSNGVKYVFGTEGDFLVPPGIIEKELEYSSEQIKDNSDFATHVLRLLNLRGFERNSPLVENNDLSIEKKELFPGFIDLFRLSNQYPNTIYEHAHNWPEGTGIVLSFSKIMDEERFNNAKKVMLEADIASNILRTYSYASTKNENFKGNAIISLWDSIVSGKTSSYSVSTQTQFQGNSTPLEELEELFRKVILPNFKDKDNMMRLQSLAFGNVDAVINTLNAHSAPSGKSFKLDWRKKKEPFDTKFLDKFRLSKRPEIKKAISSIEKINGYLDDAQSMINEDVFGRLFSLSPRQFPEVVYNWLPSLNLKAPEKEKSKEYIEIGKIINKTKEKGIFYIEKAVFAEHIAILGQTGTGKTNTIKEISNKIASLGIPTFIIESAKNEYFDMKKECKFRHIIFGKDSVTIPLFSTFYFEENGIFKSDFVRSHIGNLWNAFSGAFPLEGPMIMILQRSLENIYEKVGWAYSDIDKSYINTNGLFWPTLDDLLDSINHECNSLGYEGEIRNNIEAALTNRLLLLKSGLWKDTFKRDSPKDISYLFESNTILCLDLLSSEDEKSLIISLLFNSLRLYVRYKGWNSSHNKLNFFLVIEEAHRVIPNIEGGGGTDPHTPKNKEVAVSNFNNGITEFRSYGVGICVADQSPSKISLDVLRNVGTKIIHNIQERDDQKKAGSILGLSEAESETLSGLPDRGYALVRSRVPKIQKPSLVRITKYEPNIEEVGVEKYNKLDDDRKEKFISNYSLLNFDVKGEINNRDEFIFYNSMNLKSYGIDKILSGDKYDLTPSFLLSDSCEDCQKKCIIPTFLIMSEGENRSLAHITPEIVARKFYDFFEKYAFDDLESTGSSLLLPKTKEGLEKFFKRKKINKTIDESFFQSFSKCAIIHSDYFKPLRALGVIEMQDSRGVAILGSVKVDSSKINDSLVSIKKGIWSIVIFLLLLLLIFIERSFSILDYIKNI